MSEISSKNGKKLFQPGNRMGKGRPEGSKNKATILLEEMGEENAMAIYQSMIEKAKEGDIQSAKFIMERIMPIRKSRPLSLPIKDIKDLDKIQVAFDKLFEEMSTGKITLDEMLSLVQVLEGRVKLLDTAEWQQRVEALEDKLKLYEQGKEVQEIDPKIITDLPEHIFEED